MSNILNTAETARLLKALDNVYIYAHAHPDGDTIGSSYALSAILKKMGKRAKVVCLDTLPKYLSYILDTENADFERENTITVDVASMELLGNFNESERIILAIDHHSRNSVKCDNLLCMSEMAATGEIIFELAKELEVELDRHIAECLYTAISTDTGCFKFSNANQHTFSSVAELTRYAPNGNFGYLNVPLFITKPINKMQFESAVVSELSFYFEGKVSAAVVTNEMLKKYGLSESEAGGVEQLGKSPEGVELAVTLKERENGYKVSMRSSDDIDCSAICAEFGGGGHHSAAGCFFKDSAENIIKNILTYIEKKGIL